MPPNQPEPLEQAALRLRRQTAAVLAARRFLRWAGIWWFLWGAMVLALRTAWGASGPAAWIGAVALPLLLLLAHLRGRAAVPSLERCRALVDARTASGGLLMAAGEGLVADAWLEHAPAPAVAAVALRWRPQRLLALQAAGATFLVLSLLLPTPRLGLAKTRPPVLDLRTMLADYEARIELLAEAEILRPEEEARLVAMAKRLAGEKSADDPESAWEALDRLRDAIDEKARDAAEQALRDLVGAEQAAELIRQMARDAENGMIDGGRAADALREMARHAANQPGGQPLADMLEAAARNGQLDEQALRRLAEQTGTMGADAARQLARMAEQGMLEGDMERLAEAIAGAREQADAALADFLAQEKAAGQECRALAQAATPTGHAGISRGPGHQTLTWTAGSSEEGASFRETVLPPQRPRDWNDTRVTGTDTVAPRPLDTPLATQAGRLAGAAADGGSARVQRVLPRHRRTVAAYFDRTAAPREGSTP